MDKEVERQCHKARKFFKNGKVNQSGKNTIFRRHTPHTGFLYFIGSAKAPGMNVSQYRKMLV